MSDASRKRPVVQSYPKLSRGPTPENPFPNIASGAAAIAANNPNWRPPYAPGREPMPRLVDTEADLTDYINALRMVESSNGRNLTNSRSNARGPLQVTPAKAKELGLDPSDYDGQERAVREVDTPRSISALKANGFAPTYANLYALWWAGRKGGLGILSADDRAPITKVLGDAAIEGNFLPPDMSIGELKAWLAKRGAIDDVPAGVRIPAPAAAPDLRLRVEQGWPTSRVDQLFSRRR